ncbi:MAG: hypothetical protein IJK60_02330 [Clostridia bacterium]|nr:hypothetical protein [Clostridia bacterium]
MNSDSEAAAETGTEFENVFDFQQAYRSKKQRESALRKMTNGQIEKPVCSCGTVQGRIYYASFRKEEGASE